jgi:predicted Fe-S protein YdhL (DUF1289 family)
VGICSTTYGDLVCRGCKRFAHEIVQWNSYDAEQQQRVWQRLHELRDAVVLHHLSVSDAQAFRDACARHALEAEPGAAAIYALLGFLVKHEASLSSVGLALCETAAGSAIGDAHGDVALRVLQSIDAEVYARSTAHYERNFKIPL